MKSFLQHIHEAPMTTGGSSPLDQSTEDGRTIPAFPGLPNFTPGDPASYDNPDDAPSGPSGSPKPFIPDQNLPSLNNPTGRPRQRRDFRIPPSLLNPDSFDDDTVDMSDIIRDLLRDPVADDFDSIPVPTPLGIMPFLLPKKKK